MTQLSLSHLRSLFAVTIISASALACSSNKPAETPASSEPEPEASALPGKDPGQAQVKISPRIAEACGIQESEAYFAYNSAKVSGNADGLLVKLAECFTTGPLAGQKMNVVGHTDPRGDDEYNMTLGGRRADNLAAALANKGLPAGQMSSTSRGEAEARGTDEQSWKNDRKVELLLAD
jgi:peptidoglycan-associated lipoprotein